MPNPGKPEPKRMNHENTKDGNHGNFPYYYLLNAQLDCGGELHF
jgi:hypothetical protein